MQKTAYEMRISDWSSDVCSSDLVAACGTTVPAHAQSWAESWFDNVTYTSPGSFEDQTRGYLTAGGMSGRVDVNNDYLMSLSLPKVKAGCELGRAWGRAGVWQYVSISGMGGSLHKKQQ